MGRPEAHPTDGQPGTGPGGPARVLLVEDDDEIADVVIRGLREEGMTVERAADGDAGAAALAAGPWDIVLLDWRLPRRDGLDLLDELRARDTATPVLFLTARDAVADRVTGLRHGADDYLGKPFDFGELVARVEALLRRRDRRPPTALTFADLRLDLTTHRCLRAGHAIDLTAKEYALLALFLRHPGQVLTRSRIYEAVWDEHYDGLSNTLEMHVMELRRKLEAHGPRLIQTVRGRGYRLDPPRDS